MLIFRTLLLAAALALAANPAISQELPPHQPGSICVDDPEVCAGSHVGYAPDEEEFRAVR